MSSCIINDDSSKESALSGIFGEPKFEIRISGSRSLGYDPETGEKLPAKPDDNPITYANKIRSRIKEEENLPKRKKFKPSGIKINILRDL